MDISGYLQISTGITEQQKRKGESMKNKEFEKEVRTIYLFDGFYLNRIKELGEAIKILEDDDKFETAVRTLRDKIWSIFNGLMNTDGVEYTEEERIELFDSHHEKKMRQRRKEKEKNDVKNDGESDKILYNKKESGSCS